MFVVLVCLCWFLSLYEYECLYLCALRAGSGVVIIDPFLFLDGWRKRRLNHAPSALSLYQIFFWVCCAVNWGPFCVVLFCVIRVFYPLVVLVMLSVPVQVIDWKDSSPKWPIMCWWGTLDPTHSLTISVCILDRRVQCSECAVTARQPTHSSSEFSWKTSAASYTWHLRKQVRSHCDSNKLGGL